VDNISIFGKETIKEVFSDQSKWLKSLGPIEETVSPYMALVMEYYNTGGKKWVVKYLKRRLDDFREELRQYQDRQREFLVQAYKKGDQDTVDFINLDWSHPLEKTIGRYERLIKSLTDKRKPDELTSTDFDNARSVPMDEFVDLSNNRTRFVACPFHEEKTPSCKIYPDHFYCFGCNKGGSVIDWVMQTQKMGIRKAVLFILKR
jgi:hypothetical protein